MLLTGCDPSKDGDSVAPTDSGAVEDSTQDTHGDSYDSAAGDDTAETGRDTGVDSADSGGDSGADSGDSGADSGGDTAELGFSGTLYVADALTRIHSDTTNTDLGRIVHVGDIDGDGQLDVVAGAFLADGRTGGAWSVPGPLTVSGAAQDLGYRITGAVPNAGAGRSLSLGDVDGDGYVDIGLGAPYKGSTNGVYLSLGPQTGDVDLASAGDPLLLGPSTTYAGHGSDISGDISGDGQPDAVVGAYYTTSRQGLTFVAYGPVSDDVDLETAYDARLEGESSGVYAGRIVRAGPDLDGDGVGDLIIACLGDMPLPASGGFYVVHGPVSGDIDLADAEGRYGGESVGNSAGLWLDAGDVSGDGLADVVAASFDNTYVTTAGAAYVVYGPAADKTALTDADIIVRGDVSGQYGGGVAMGDLDEDGTDELLLGAQGDPTAGGNAGAVYLFSDPAPGSYVFSDGDAAFFAEGPGDNLGTGMAVGDVDGDHVPEIVMGAPYQDDGGYGAGAFYVMHAF